MEAYKLKVSMNGLRTNLARTYNGLVRELISQHEDGLIEIDGRLGSLIDEHRMHVDNLCLVYSEDDEDFTDISEKIDLINVIEKLGLGEEEEDQEP